MERIDKYDYWKDIAEYDLATAEAMYNTGRWLYVVFMCQQAIEKLCKGLYVFYADDNIPRSHNINFIINKFSDTLSFEINDMQLKLFERLTAFYIEGRYPEYKEKLSVSINKGTAEQILNETKEAFKCLLMWKI